MKVSLNIIKQLINFELPPVDELVARINQQLGGVEEVIDLNAKYMARGSFGWLSVLSILMLIG